MDYRSVFTYGELTDVLGEDRAGLIAELIMRARVDKGSYVGKRAFVIPSGQFAGKRPASLTGVQLQQAWSGFNGCGNQEVADELLKEIKRRERSTVRHAKKKP